MNVKPRYLTENIIEDLNEKMVFLGSPRQVGKTTTSFLRDSTGREVDFIVTVKNRPWFAVEVKNSDSAISRNLYYFKEKLSIPFNYQVVKKCRNERVKNGIRVMPAGKFLAGLI